MVKVFWKYSIDVFDDTIRTVKEVGLWAYEVPTWKRVAWVQEYLPYQVGWFESSDDPCPEGRWFTWAPTMPVLYVVKDRIRFHGGFLIISDPGQKDLMEYWGESAADFSDLSDATRDEIKSLPNHIGDPYYGENVRVLANFKNFVPVPDSCDAPLICLPQGGNASLPGSLVLSERQDLGITSTRRCVFKISPEAPTPTTDFTSKSFHIEDSSGFYQLNVSQDRDSTGLNVRFEAQADSIPLPWNPPVTPEERYPFGLGPRTFYVGFEPNGRGPGLHNLFLGEIKRCDFDPNASCQACP